MGNLSLYEQRVLLYSMIRNVSKCHLVISDSSQANGDLMAKARAGVAGLLVEIAKDIPSIQDSLFDWLVGTSAEAVSYSHNTHRAVVAALSLENGQPFGSDILCFG